MTSVSQTIGKYKILKEIGSGGYSTVYEAYDPTLNRPVAIKVLRSLEPSMTNKGRQRLLREAKTVAQLNHPNIATIYDIGFEGDLSYIVMPIVSEHSLRDLLGKPMDLSSASNLINQIAQALDYAHGHGVVHRDIKPANILLENDQAILTDFGLAKLIDQESTSSERLIGTPTYMAPEQVKGEAITPETDIYALGVILFEMLTGHTPFEANSLTSTFTNLVSSEPPPSPRALDPEMPVEVEQVILKALSKNPAGRYHTAGEMAQALQALTEAIKTVPSVLEYPLTVKFTSVQEISPSNLANTISPYLQAIADLQHLIDEIKNQPKKKVKVINITQGSALISLEGATEAIELIMSVVVPWRHKHAKTMAKLEESEKQVQIESAKADILANRKQAATDKEKAEIELARQRVEVEKLELENAKLRLELHREKIQLALDVVNRINPNFAEAAKIDYITRLLGPLDVLISSDLEPKLLGLDLDTDKGVSNES